ncbi:MAG: response regulator [Gemmatimonadetes bacterium]|nr:MAG: response regulator [Gemmatimonadota bacterium]
MRFYGKILIADDDPKLAKILQLGLKRQGFDVIVAHDGQEAVALSRDPEVALIIMDGLMPQINGFEASKRIKEYINPNAKIILLTAVYTQAKFILEKDKWGIDSLMKKPFTLEILMKEISRLFPDLDQPAEETSPSPELHKVNIS